MTDTLNCTVENVLSTNERASVPTANAMTIIRTTPLCAQAARMKTEIMTRNSPIAKKMPPSMVKRRYSLCGACWNASDTLGGE